MAFCEKPPKRVDLFKISNLFFQAEDGIRDPLWSRGLGDVYKRQHQNVSMSLKLATFLCKLPCFTVLTKFLAKSCKNYDIL